MHGYFKLLTMMWWPIRWDYRSDLRVSSFLRPKMQKIECVETRRAFICFMLIYLELYGISPCAVVWQCSWSCSLKLCLIHFFNVWFMEPLCSYPQSCSELFSGPLLSDMIKSTFLTEYLHSKQRVKRTRVQEFSLIFFLPKKSLHSYLELKLEST